MCKRVDISYFAVWYYVLWRFLAVKGRFSIVIFCTKQTKMGASNGLTEFERSAFAMLRKSCMDGIGYVKKAAESHINASENPLSAQAVPA